MTNIHKGHPAPCDSSDDSCGSFVYLSLDMQDEISGRTCRVCWDPSDSRSLISPCQCKGTQKYVHVKCLRRWQENVQKRDLRDERAYRCGVCREAYSLPPPDPRWSTRLWRLFRIMACLTCTIFIASGIAGPPWPYLGLLVFLFLITARSQSLLLLCLLSAAAILASFHSRGLRLVMKFDDTSGRIGIALVRYGSRVPGLGPGTLLVARDALDHSIFRKSVVLVFAHGNGGAQGVILNQPMGSQMGDEVAMAAMNASVAINPGSSQRQDDSSMASTKEGGAIPKHFLGGPVGMPGEGVRQEIAVLHTMHGIEGAISILPRPHNTGNHDDDRNHHQYLYQGGRLADVLERLSSSAASSATKNSPPSHQSVFVYHGISTWAEGQLEGEIRAGVWAYGDAFQDDILNSDFQHMWEVMLSSGRMTWLA